MKMRKDGLRARYPIFLHLINALAAGFTQPMVVNQVEQPNGEWIH